MNELEEFIKIRFNTEASTLHDEGIKVFRSAQVSLTNPDPDLVFYEVSAAFAPNGNTQKKKKKGANSKTLINQTLKVGDVLISARTKLKKVTLIEDKLLNKEIPTVAMNGVIIIRTGNINLGQFIKYYLELPEVQDYINNDPRTSKKGKRIIPIKLISELQFPNIFKNDFQAFVKHNNYFESISSKAQSINIILNILTDLQLAEACTIDIDNDNSYNLDRWKKVDESLDSLRRSLESTNISIRVQNGDTRYQEILHMLTPLLESPYPPKKTK